MKNWLSELLIVSQGVRDYLNKPTQRGYGERRHTYVWPWRKKKIFSLKGKYRYNQYQAYCRAIKIYDSGARRESFIRLFRDIEFIRSVICAYSLYEILFYGYMPAYEENPEKYAGGAWTPSPKIINIAPELNIRAEFDKLISEQDGKQENEKICRTITRSYLIKCLITTQKIIDADLNSPLQNKGFNDWNLLEQLRKVSTHSSFYPTAQRMAALLEDPAIVKEMMKYQGVVSKEAAREYSCQNAAAMLQL